MRHRTSLNLNVSGPQASDVIVRTKVRVIIDPMRKVEQIEQQIRELTAGEFSELRDWVLDQDWKAWDAQIQADARSGKLDQVIAEAEADYKAGRTRPL